MEKGSKNIRERWHLNAFNKYAVLVKVEWQRILTFRFSMLCFRIGSFLNILVQVIIWSAIFHTVDIVSGYTYQEMITYVIIGSLFSVFTTNYGFEGHIARLINHGQLSNILVQPISFLRYITAAAVGRSSITMLTSFVMLGIVVVLFFDKLLPPADSLSLLLIMPMVIMGFFIKLFLSILAGLIALWTVYVNGIYSSIEAIVKFLSGSFFSLSLLPAVFVSTSMAFPFIYIFYFPAQLYLGKASLREGLIGLGVEILWLLALYGIIKIVWHFGLKKYESVGI